MRVTIRRHEWTATLGVALTILWLGGANPAAADDVDPGAAGALNPCAAKTINPCAAKTINPCAAKTLNPCAAKTLNPCAARTLNPCATKTLNPCAAKTLNPCLAKTLNPCRAKTLNPCEAKGGASNPCNPCGGGGHVDPALFKQPTGMRLGGGNRDALVAEGQTLWEDRSLGKSGLACASCHIDNTGQMQPTFAEPYPHRVAMPEQRAGVSEVTAAEMVNFCMVVPMMSDPLPWNSRDLAALTAYVESIQAGFEPAESGGGNPCAAKNNPCNPCGARGY